MNQRETKMMTMLGVVAFFGLNLILYSSYKDQKKRLINEKDKVAMEVKTRNDILTEGVVWNNAQEWFEKNKPEAVTLEDAQDKLLKEVKSAAERCKLTISPTKPINFLPAISDGQYPRARVTLNFTCPDDALFQWTTQMNDSKKFRVVTALKVEPHNTDKSNVTVDAIVEQWVSPADIVAEVPADSQQQPALAAPSPQK